MLAQAWRQDPDSVIVPRRRITVVVLRPQFPKPNSSDSSDKLLLSSYFFWFKKIPLANSCRLSQTQPHCLTLDLPCYSCHGWCSSWVFIEGTDTCRLLTLTSWHLLSSWPCYFLRMWAGAALSRPRTGRLRGADAPLDPFDPFDPWVRREPAIDTLQNLPVRQRMNGLAKAPWPQLDSHKRARCVCLLLSRPEMIWDRKFTSVETNSGWNLQSLHSCFC